MATDTGELHLEKQVVVKYLCDHNDYEEGSSSKDFNRDYAIDTVRLKRFLEKTQMSKIEKTGIFKTPYKEKEFFSALSNELSEKGVAAVLRGGFKYLMDFDLYYPLPSKLSDKDQLRYNENIFSVIKELKYSNENDNRIDLMISVNGLPVMTIELKNTYTGECVEDAVIQYKYKRNANELLLRPKRCAVHFAVDDMEAKMCTWLCNSESDFIPFNKGVNGGAGNPDNGGIRTSYIWEEILTKKSLSDIIENYAWVVRKKDKKKDKKNDSYKESVIWPCYHQLDCVHKLLDVTQKEGLGHSYLIQHSAGSGKSYSMTWLTYQLASMMNGTESVVDSVIVVTDRVVLDKQLRDNVLSFNKMKNKVAWASDGGDLKDRLKEGKEIIVTTIQKFVSVIKTIGTDLKSKRFAIIIDEAHSSQNGRLSAKMNMSLSGDTGDGFDLEDRILKAIQSRKNLPNANYYAFTATPKWKTLNKFGTPVSQPDGTIKREPFHEYTMRQAIEEGNIKNVLEHYITYSSLYKIVSKAKDDPRFDKKGAMSLLLTYAEEHPKTIKKKSDIIVNHFLDSIIGKGKVGGKARAMLITSSVDKTIKYFYEINDQLKKHHSPYRAIVAFRGKRKYAGEDITDSKLNKFAQSKIEEKFEEDPYRILICCDMFQTGFDQPLLHTMYVDKKLRDEMAVQTLSRPNRRHPKKLDTCIVDFCNKAEDIQKAFQRFYNTTILTDEVDPHQLDTLISEMEKASIYTKEEIEEANKILLLDNNRMKLDGIVNKAVTRFNGLDKDNKELCKSAITKYLRNYPYIASVIEFESIEWEKLFNYLALLINKLPKDNSKPSLDGLFDAISLRHFIPVLKGEKRIILENKKSEVKSEDIGTPQKAPQSESDFLSEILKEWHNIHWTDQDNAKQAFMRLPGLLASDQSFINAAKNSNRETAMQQSSEVLMNIILGMMNESPEFCQKYLSDKDFMTSVNLAVFDNVYDKLKKDGISIVFENHYHGTVESVVNVEPKKE